jgi:threonine dehydrogenase-like Zn-dependent dehydrogenase
VYERADYEKALEMLAAGVIPADKLITRIEPIEATAAAFDALSTGGVMKVLIDCQGAHVAERAQKVENAGG